MDAPRILLFTGDGRGKTTAALGLALRAAGHGHAVRVIQFCKSQDTGELHASVAPGAIEITQAGRGFLPPRDDARWAQHEAAARDALDLATRAIASGKYGVVVLDEVCFAVQAGLIEEAAVIAALRGAPPDLCIVLTGRGATPGLIALADTVTEMRCVKHALSAGRPAQKGVEF